MRILHVNKFLYRRGGAEAYVHEIADRQRAAGHDVTLFGMQHPHNPALPLADTFPSAIEFDREDLSATDKARAAARMVWSTSARRGMDAAIARFEPDVVHLHNIYHALSPSILQPLRDHGAAVVMTLHDYKLVCPTYQMLAHGRVCDACVTGGTRQALIRRCSQGSIARSGLVAFESGVHRAFGAYDPVRRFICPSRFLADTMRRGGMFPDRLRVVNNFVDVERVPRRATVRQRVVYAGRLSTEKGVDVLVDALARLPRVEAVIAGEGHERPALERRAAEVAPGRVTFVGRLDRDGVLALLAQAGVAVLPSRWHENQPMAILEAFAVGVPVVTTTLGGGPELVTDGVTGRLVPPNEPAALARAIADVLGDVAANERMGAASRERAVASFGPELHLAALERVYAEARTTVVAA